MNLKITIYNLISKEQSIIKGPKNHEKGIFSGKIKILAWAFSSNKKFLAVAERRDKKDFIAIYYCMNWQLVNYFQAGTFDLSDLAWSPNDSFILVWDTCLAYRVVVYCPSKTQIFKHEIGNNSLGVKVTKMSPKSEYLALGTYDDKVKLYNTLCWRIICDIEFKFNPNDIEDIKFYKEEITNEHANTYDDSVLKKCKVFLTKNLVVQVNSFRIQPTKNMVVDINKQSPEKNGLLIEWDSQSNYLAIKNETYPNYLWIWDMTTMNMASIIQC